MKFRLIGLMGDEDLQGIVAGHLSDKMNLRVGSLHYSVFDMTKAMMAVNQDDIDADPDLWYTHLNSINTSLDKISKSIYQWGIENMGEGIWQKLVEAEIAHTKNRFIGKSKANPYKGMVIQGLDRESDAEWIQAIEGEAWQLVRKGQDPLEIADKILEFKRPEQDNSMASTMIDSIFHTGGEGYDMATAEKMKKDQPKYRDLH